MPASQRRRANSAMRAPDARPSSTPTSTEAALPATKPRIMLLDDDPFILGLHSRMLQAMGYPQVSTSGSAEEVLAGVAEDPLAFDVAICDLNMPRMDGIEFLQALNASAFTGKVILISGESTRIMHTVQKLLGGSRIMILGALEKPAARDALDALLSRWLPQPDTSSPGKVRQFSTRDIRHAVVHGEWVLHFQPKVDLRTGAIAGVESLIRWNHPEHGLVYPDRFISIAEDCGAIEAITDWVLREAIRQMAIWRDQGLAVSIAMNVSMENLRDADFARRLGRMVREASLSPADMTLEVTESRLMSSSLAPLENLVRLRLQRFGLSIDDFGTGHSSLAQLRDVPFTELKVDRSFVHGARFNPIIRPILEGSIGLARRLGMQSVAEGVETEEDWDLLREIDCDFAQGYFIGRPMPAAQLPEWLGGWKDRRRSLVPG